MSAGHVWRFPRRKQWRPGGVWAAAAEATISGCQVRLTAEAAWRRRLRLASSDPTVGGEGRAVPPIAAPHVTRDPPQRPPVMWGVTCP